MCIVGDASSLVCNKDDCSWVSKRKERMNETRGYCETAQSAVKSIPSVYNNADCVTYNDIAATLSSER